jgi:hypothetical protein
MAIIRPPQQGLFIALGGGGKRTSLAQPCAPILPCYELMSKPDFVADSMADSDFSLTRFQK